MIVFIFKHNFGLQIVLKEKMKKLFHLLDQTIIYQCLLI